MKKTTETWIGLPIAIIGAGAIIYLRFSNPEMTETQLFINHWFDFIVATACLAYGVSLYLGEK